MKNVKSITPVKSVSPVNSIKEVVLLLLLILLLLLLLEVVGLYKLTPEQASRLRELNEISETRTGGFNRIVSMTSRPLRMG